MSYIIPNVRIKNANQATLARRNAESGSESHNMEVKTEIHIYFDTPKKRNINESIIIRSKSSEKDIDRILQEKSVNRYS